MKMFLSFDPKGDIWRMQEVLEWKGYLRTWRDTERQTKEKDTIICVALAVSFNPWIRCWIIQEAAREIRTVQEQNQATSAYIH